MYMYIEKIRKYIYIYTYMYTFEKHRTPLRISAQAFLAWKKDPKEGTPMIPVEGSPIPDPEKAQLTQSRNYQH